MLARKGRLILGVVTAAIAAVVALGLAIGLPLAMVFTAQVGGSLQAQESAGGVCLQGATGNGSTASAPRASGSIRKQQLENAKLIDSAAKKIGLSGRATEIAIIAAFGETSLLNLGYGDQVNGVRNPDGSLATSFGLFQQQTSQGWGTREQVMNPIHAATSFFLGPKHDGAAGLVSVPNWETGEPTLVINKVQHNADPNHYVRSYMPAREIIHAAGIDITRPGKEGAGKKKKDDTATTAKNRVSSEGEDCGANGRARTVGTTKGNDDYPWNAPPAGVYVVDPMNFYYGECTSFAAWRVNRDAKSKKAPFIFTNTSQGVIKGNAATWHIAWAQKGWKVSKKPVTGAVAQWTPYGKPGIGEHGHVGYVSKVYPDGDIDIEEYNNAGIAGVGHRYSKRVKVPADTANNYLYPPAF